MRSHSAHRMGIALALLFAAGAAAQCSWSGEDLVGVDDRVYGQAVWDPDQGGPLGPVLVMAGQFLNVGSLPANRVATWDGSQWRTLGSGLNGTARAVVEYNGALVVAGDFSSAGGVPAAGIALYDGSWHALGSGMDAPVYALAVYGAELYAGGLFTQAGGQTAIAIAKWNGTTWSAVGAGMNGAVYTLHTHSGQLYAGGSFSAAGGSPAACVASWDGTTWSPLGAGLTTTYLTPVARSMADFNGQLVVGGQFTQAGAVTTNSIAEWDGTAWHGLATGITARDCPGCADLPAKIDAIAPYGADLYAGGDGGSNPNAAFAVLSRWNGTAWTAVPQFSGGQGFDLTNALTEYGGQLYVSGRFGGAGLNGYTNFTARYDGASWGKVGGFDLLVHQVCSYQGSIVAAGEFYNASGQPAHGVAIRNGSTWQAVGAYPFATARAVVPYGSELVTIDSGVHHWNGTTWSALGSIPTPDRIFVLGGQLYATVQFGSFPSPVNNAIAHWNGTAWEALGSGVSNARSMTLFNGNVLAAGTFSGLGETVARWNGLGWVALGPAFGDSPDQLTVYNGDPVACWVNMTLPTTGRVTRWNGSAWVQMGGVFSPGISNANCVGNMAAVGNNLYVGGFFTQIGGVPFNYAAVWNGSAWLAMDSGLNAPAYSVTVVDGRPIFAGQFSTAGSVRTGFMAYWNCPACYANCDNSTTAPTLNVLDFACFLNRFAAGDSYANCDGSTTAPVLNVLDFACFLNTFAAGCP